MWENIAENNRITPIIKGEQIIDQAVCEVDLYRVVSFVQLSGPASWFRLYKETQFQFMSTMAAFHTGDFRFRDFSKKSNNVMDE